jgi:hypothetical protein
MTRRVGLILLVALAAAAGAATAQARRLPVYRSPGYHGVHKVPPLKPAQPLTPIDLGTGGRNPQVLVDQAGTAHIVWTEAGHGSPDLTRYCRIKRGSKTCDNPPASQRLVPAQPGDPQFNNEYHVRVLAVGNDVAIISYRYPNVTQKPDGSASSDSTYMWLSTDGGNSFGDPVLVGDQDPSGDAAVFGSPDNPRIGLISDTQTGGTFFQALAPGTYTGAKANLDEGDANRAYGGTLAPVGAGLVAAFADASGNAYVRYFDGTGNPNDASAWTPSPPSFPGSEPRLAFGPTGLFVLARGGLLRSAPLQIRRMNGVQAGPPIQLSDTSDAGTHAFVEDASGELLAAWTSSQRPDIRLRTSTDGAHWGSDQLLAAGGHSLEQVHLATTFDGGGFATWVRDGQDTFGDGTVQAVQLGPQGPTGRLGLGDLPGGAADPSVVESCQRISFAVVTVTTQQGCFLTAANGSGVRVSQGPVRINGVDVIPDPGTRILINARARTIDTVGPVSVQLRPLSDTSVEIFHGEVHTKVTPGASGASAADDQATHGTLFSFDTKTFPVNLRGFPVEGKISVELVPGGTRIPISLELPKVFGGVTGEAELRTSEKDGLELNSLHIEADTIPIGPMFITDLVIDYQGGSEDTWTGGATLVLPPPGVAPRIGAKVTFKAGKFKEGTITAGPPYPGILIAPDTFVTQLTGGFGVDPLAIILGAHLGAIPIAPPNEYTIGVTGTIKLSFGNPLTYQEEGTGELLGVKLETARLLANTDGYIHLNGEAKLDLDVLNAQGQIDAFIDGAKKQFGGRVAGNICIVGVCSTGGDLVVSSRGVGACITTLVSYGFGYHWGDPLTKVKLMFGSCDLGPYTLTAPGQAREAQSRFTVRPGTTLESLQLVGSGGPPDVTLVSPQGQRIVPVPVGPGADTAPAVSLAVPSHSTTYVALRRPAAGTWSVEANPGSAPIAQLGLARAQPKPSVRGRVSGHGSRRTLSYRLSGGTGLSATFYEVGREGSQVIGRATGAQGRLSFTPAYGPGGRRQIVALVERDGVLRLRASVATYTAPAPSRPGRVPSLHLNRTRSAVSIAWRPAAGASRYLVRVNLSDGRHLARLLGTSARSLRLAGVSKSVRASVSIRGIDTHGRGGPLSRLRG